MSPWGPTTADSICACDTSPLVPSSFKQVMLEGKSLRVCAEAAAPRARTRVVDWASILYRVFAD